MRRPDALLEEPLAHHTEAHSEAPELGSLPPPQLASLALWRTLRLGPAHSRCLDRRQIAKIPQARFQRCSHQASVNIIAFFQFTGSSDGAFLKSLDGKGLSIACYQSEKVLTKPEYEKAHFIGLVHSFSGYVVTIPMIPDNLSVLQVGLPLLRIMISLIRHRRDANLNYPYRL